MEDNSTVRTIGSSEVGGTPQLTEEDVEKMIDKDKVKKYARKQIMLAFKTQIKQVKEELALGKTLDDILAEIKEKKSKLPRVARDFVVNFEQEAINDMIEAYDELKQGKKFTPEIKKDTTYTQALKDCEVPTDSKFDVKYPNGVIDVKAEEVK